MVRGRGYSPRGGGYRGSSRGNSFWNGNSRGNYSGSSGGRFSSPFSAIDSRSKYGTDRFSGGRPHSDDYHKSYRSESSYMGRDNRRSPERKRMRTEASSRHDSFYGGYGSRHDPSSYSERRGYSGERYTSSTPFSSRREDFRRPSGPPSRGSYRGRISSRGSRGLKLRDRAGRRRLIESSYAIQKRALVRSTAYNRRLKISKMRSAIAKKRLDEKEESGDEASKEKKDKTGEEKEGEEKDGEKAPKEEGEETESKAEGPEDKLKKRKTFIKLQCPHCGIKVLTFRKYEIHLISRPHLMAMRKVAIKQKSILAQMRQAQRNTQNELEKSSDDLTEKTSFCPLCKLNYKQKKAVHQLSEAHKNMKKFLMPHCKICNITFKSPMSHESHCCSIKHIKRKQRLENSSDASGEEDNLENFTTIDSVGDGDVGSESGEKKEEAKELVNVGIEKIRQIEVHYCDLCKMYLPRADETEMPEILSKHCKQKVHLKRYIRFKEDKDLEKHAEKLQRKENAEKVEVKEETAKDSVNSDEIKEETTNESASKLEDEEARDDKLWADVDKDLGDILAEAESGNKSSDEDEDDSHVNGERYDRFKLSILNDNANEEKETEEK